MDWLGLPMLGMTCLCLPWLDWTNKSMCKSVSVTVNAKAGSQTCVFAAKWRWFGNFPKIVSELCEEKTPGSKSIFDWISNTGFFLCIGHILDSISSFSSWLALWMALIAYRTYLTHEFGVFGIWYGEMRVWGVFCLVVCHCHSIECILEFNGKLFIEQKALTTTNEWK